MRIKDIIAEEKELGLLGKTKLKLEDSEANEGDTIKKHRKIDQDEVSPLTNKNSSRAEVANKDDKAEKDVNLNRTDSQKSDRNDRHRKESDAIKSQEERKKDHESERITRNKRLFGTMLSHLEKAKSLLYKDKEMR